LFFSFRLYSCCVGVVFVEEGDLKKYLFDPTLKNTIIMDWVGIFSPQKKRKELNLSFILELGIITLDKLEFLPRISIFSFFKRNTPEKIGESLIN
jgi:hypothetical protein